MEIETMQLGANAWVPNNPHLPVRVYRSAIEVTGEPGAERFEMLFTDNGWRPDWRDGVYDYHHYHSTAHEALGVFAGTAVLELGGPDGEQIIVTAGDAVLLPAGTGHRCLEASDDFQVVGAYPRGQDWDICRSADDGALARIAALPDPAHDPITGASGAALSA